jgi:hypothetical protein
MAAMSAPRNQSRNTWTRFPHASSMSDSTECADPRYEMLRRLRVARSEFHTAVTHAADTRERVFAPHSLLRSIRNQVANSAIGSTSERSRKLFMLTVLLYGALDWQFAGFAIDVETDVQLERMRQNHLHGGADSDDRLSAEEWRERLLEQALRLEQQTSCDDGYAACLVKLTALAQAALEAACRQSTQPDALRAISQ